MEVSPLSHEVMLLKLNLNLNLYPLDYRMAFAFSILPYQQSAWARLAACFPSGSAYSMEKGSSRGRTTGLPLLCECQSVLGLTCLPVARHLRQVS